jgi:hypothetical protein
LSTAIIPWALVTFAIVPVLPGWISAQIVRQVSG